MKKYFYTLVNLVLIYLFKNIYLEKVRTYYIGGKSSIILNIILLLAVGLLTLLIFKDTVKKKDKVFSIILLAITLAYLLSIFISGKYSNIILNAKYTALFKYLIFITPGTMYLSFRK